MVTAMLFTSLNRQGGLDRLAHHKAGLPTGRDGQSALASAHRCSCEGIQWATNIAARSIAFHRAKAGIGMQDG